ncbi:MAG: hypothetical protein WC511_04665 [Candidatus Pacearchaeota archaeon]
MQSKKIGEIKDKLHKDFTESLMKKGFDKIWISTGIVKDKKGKVRFLEVIIEDRNIRWSNPEIMKKIPKTYKGIKVRAF